MRKLKSIEIKNFKGIPSFKLDFDKETNVHGANRAGKTTLFDAHVWLFSGKNSEDKQAFTIKPQTKKGDPIHHLETLVEEVWEIDGEDISLKRVFSEVWRKKSGSTEKQLTSHKTDYYIDGIPKKEKEYNSHIEKDFNLSMVKLLSNPLYFNSLKDEKKREVIMSFAGEISNDVILDSFVDDQNRLDYKSLIFMLEKGHSLTDAKKRIKDSITKLNKDYDRIPSRIDEVQRDMPKKVNETKIKAEIKNKEDELKKIEEEEKSLLKTIKAEQESLQFIKDKISQLETKKYTIEKNIKKNASLVVDKEQSKKDKLKKECESLKKNIDSKEKEVKENERKLSELDAKINPLRENVRGIAAEKFELDPNSTICPTCKQELENAEDIATKLEQNFNLDKAERVENLNIEGKKLVESKAELEKSIEDKTISLIETKAKHSELLIKFQEVKVPELKYEYSGNEDWDKVVKEISEQEAKITEPKAKGLDDDRKQEKELILSAVSELKDELRVNDTVDKKEARIDQLKSEQQDITNKVNDLNKELNSITEFEESKMRIVESRVNDKFNVVKFRLFERHMNGEPKPCCVCLVDGVPFDDANNAGQVQAGLDIISAFSEKYDQYFPIFIDNRESVTEIPEMKCQIVNLVVNPLCKELTKMDSIVPLEFDLMTAIENGDIKRWLRENNMERMAEQI